MIKENSTKVDLFCIASGPSLVKEDCISISNTDTPILAVNNSWKITPRCDYLFAGDVKWWNVYGQEVPDSIQKWTSSKKAAEQYAVNLFPASGAFNSGMRAILWALKSGFRNIALLGYDCSLEHGIHWHADHDTKKMLSNPDATKVEKWKLHFFDVYARAGRLNANIINCSRFTALKIFNCDSLENVLARSSKECVMC